VIIVEAQLLICFGFKKKLNSLIPSKQKISLKAISQLLQEVVEPSQQNEMTLLIVVYLKDLIKRKKVYG